MSSIQKILINNYFVEHQFGNRMFDKPIFFGVPTIPFHITATKIEDQSNFFEKTIMFFHDKGYNADEVADMLCLDVHLVKTIISKNVNSLINFKVHTQECEEKEYIIFYDLYSKQFINNAMKLEVYEAAVRNADCRLFSNNELICNYSKSVGEIFAPEIFLLPANDLRNYPKPSTTKDLNTIIKCLKMKDTYGKESYNKIEYKGEDPITYIVTKLVSNAYNSNFNNIDCYDVVDPFHIKNDDYISIYFKRIFEDYVNKKPKLLLTKRFESYKENIRKTAEISLRRKMNSLKQEDEKIKNKLEELFNKNKLFKDDLLFPYMHLIQNFNNINFAKIKDIEASLSEFYDAANRGLEAIFKTIYFKYKNNLSELIDKGTDGDLNQFISYNNSDLESRGVIEKYSNELGLSFYDEKIRNKFDVSKVIEIIRKKSNKSQTTNIRNWYIINLITAYYFPDSKFIQILDKYAEKIINFIDFIPEKRNQNRHDTWKINLQDKHYHEEVYDLMFEILNKYLGTNVKIKDVNFEENSEVEEIDLSILLQNFNEVKNMDIEMESKCHKIIKDFGHGGQLLYSQCISLFEPFYNIILNYCFDFGVRNVNDMREILDKIDNDIKFEVELLQNKYPQYDFTNILKDKNNDDNVIKVNIKDTKKQILDGIKKVNHPSSCIIFSLLLLFHRDVNKFEEIMSKLGQSYLDDFLRLVYMAGHSKELCYDNLDEKEELINRLIKYCKIFSEFNE